MPCNKLLRIFLCGLALHTDAFVSTRPGYQSQLFKNVEQNVLRQQHISVPMVASTSAADAPLQKERDLENAPVTKKESKWQMVRREGGIFAFPTKYGALNLYGIYYGLVAIFFGIPWYFALTFMQLFYFVTRNKIDPDRKMCSLINQAWGWAVALTTLQFPRVENKEILKEFYKQKRCAMFVGNHNSWMDIPFMGLTIGWRNYKTVSKVELGKVPILGKAIRVTGNVMVNRADRKSQLKTLKKGIDYLKRGVHLCTFPEGTRTKTGRLGEFKNGAFKMAHKAGAPVIPLSIVASGTIQPSHWMFPIRHGLGMAKVIVHPPVESVGRTEEELAQAVREAMISGLPEDQRPRDK